MCPKKTNRWAHLDNTLKFYISRRRKIVEHTDAHAHFESPSAKWWTITLAVAPAISEINKTVVQLQNRSFIIIQQKIKIELLKDLLISMFKVKGIIEINDDEADKFDVDGNWCVEHQHIIEHIKDQGSFSQECYASLDENNQKDVVLQISQFALFIVAGCDSVKAERDGNNNASELDAPPVVPHELVKLAPRHFISDVLNIYRPRLDRFWSEEEIDEIEVEQRDLIKRYNNDQHIEQIINSYKHTVSFNEAWDKIGVPFNRLRQFCGGLATTFPNTTSVKSDFSILKWEKDDNCSSMTDLTLEGIFQCKQMNQIPIL
jgi:hypothetical protein